MDGGRIVSVNVGTARQVEWQGRPLTSAIVKAPVEGAVPLRGVNLVGDDQADRKVHGGPDRAVYAYAAEDYAWWSGELATALAPGTFGENLTTTGLDPSGAPIGERWQVGGAVLEVAGPRIPCVKLGWRMNDPHFVKRFADALRLGAYFRIIEPGAIARGDTVTVLHRPSHDITVREVGHIYFSAQQRRRELLAVPELGQAWLAWAERER